MKEKYIQDIAEIKDIMKRSSRLISLSGLSGVSAGFTALIGLYLLFHLSLDQYFTHNNTPNGIFERVLILACSTLLLALGAAAYFTVRESRKKGVKVWDIHTKMLLTNLMIPLVTGGSLCLILGVKGSLELTPSLTLLFYGLGLINASRYTYEELKNLGFIEILLGLIAAIFIDYSLIVWGLGFGLLHIIYGIIMQFKYRA
ncbi:hypothetical protein [Ekhidna sp.]|uniref:hypothetical protein n=1 Tax=Ekhidna sp. TaxID=2608089 RepID=UPI003C7CEF59